jgi:uroporphyrinogen decarboxylase
MTPRERNRETICFGTPDKVPLRPGGPRESTLAAWHQQGLPEDVHYFDHLLEVLNIEPEPKVPRVDTGVSFKMIPQFEEKVLEHKEGHYIVQDWMGAVTEISDTFDYTYIRSAKDFVTRKWHRFPVQSRDDWEQMKTRFYPQTPGRYPDDFEQRCASLRNTSHIVSIHMNGPFWQLREWLGMENLCMLMIDEPEWVEEMISFWTTFVSDTMAPILKHMKIDEMGMSEDMAYKGFSMISPEMTRRFLTPSYNRWIPELRQNGCPIISMDSDGYIGELIPIWIESGINCCGPMEVAAENNLVAFRETYGTQMAYTGGIDKRAIAKGGDVMRKEVYRVVPPLFEMGGYIPGCDHGVPPDISWPDYINYSRLLAELTGWL